MCSFCTFSPCRICLFVFFFFNDTATTEIYTLSLHDALPICAGFIDVAPDRPVHVLEWTRRSEEHTSELQSRFDLVCRLLLEKKKTRLLPLHIRNKRRMAADSTSTSSR